MSVRDVEMDYGLINHLSNVLLDAESIVGKGDDIMQKLFAPSAFIVTAGIELCDAAEKERVYLDHYRSTIGTIREDIYAALTGWLPFRMATKPPPTVSSSDLAMTGPE